MTKPAWYVLTGGPSSGKTTLLAELQKLGYAVVPEAARAVIDEAAARGITPAELRKDEKKFQDTVMRRKIAIENEQPSDALTFFDRGMHDTIAYFRHYGYEVEDWIRQACQRASYEKVFLLEPLANYEKDYARTEDDGFYQRIHQLLQDAYEEAGIPIVSIPPVSVADRVTMILNEIKVEATKLG